MLERGRLEPYQFHPLTYELRAIWSREAGLPGKKGLGAHLPGRFGAPIIRNASANRAGSAPADPPARWDRRFTQACDASPPGFATLPSRVATRNPAVRRSRCGLERFRPVRSVSTRDRGGPVRIAKPPSACATARKLLAPFLYPWAACRKLSAPLCYPSAAARKLLAPLRYPSAAAQKLLAPLCYPLAAARKLLAPLRYPSAAKAIGASPLPVGGCPKAIGASPLPVGGWPKGIGACPFTGGGTPKAIGGSPKPIGRSPRRIGGSRNLSARR